MHPKVHKPPSWSRPVPGKISPSFEPHPDTERASQPAPPSFTKAESEYEAFTQDQYEAFSLQLKKKAGALAPADRERVDVLQTRLNAFWARRLKQANAQPEGLEARFRSMRTIQAPEPATSDQAGVSDAGPEPPVETEPNPTGLPDNLKAGVESLSGYSLAAVRVHYDSPEPAQFDALAYTQGTEIHVAPGQEKFLPHEAWHVVQQMQGRVSPTRQMKGGVPVNEDAGLEQEADRRGAKALAAGALSGDASRLASVTHPSPNRVGVIQRQVVSKIEVDDDWIDDVIIGGRTPSPFSGTMGAHSTAWIAHIDAIRRQLVNSPLSDGIQTLIDLAKEEINSPLMELENLISENHQKQLQAARINLMIRIMDAQNALDEGTTTQKVQELRKLINAYLTLVNYLPMATVAGGDPSGHGEGSARGDLNLFEYMFANVKQFGEEPFSEEFRDEISQLSSEDDYQTSIKSQASAGFEDSPSEDTLRQMLIERLWTMFAAETPEVFLRGKGASFLDTLKVWYFAIRNFLKTIRAAYPYAYDFTGMHQVERQISGLGYALDNAHILLETAFFEELKTLLRKYPISEEAEWREDHNEVAASDFRQSGTGFQASILLEDDDRIGDVEMIGRTMSPFSGTMGAHSTAWAAHLDAVRRALIGKRLGEAIAKMKAKSEKALKDRGLELSGLISEKHQLYLIGAYNVLEARIREADEEVSSIPIEQLEFLEQFIGDYLSFINFLPLSTVEVGNVPGGRREGEHRNFLLEYEERGEGVLPLESRHNKEKILREHIWGLYDPSAVRAFPPKLGQRENINFSEYLFIPFTKAHALYRYVHKKKKPVANAREVVEQRFYHTMQEAYPRAMADSGLMVQETEEKLKHLLVDEDEFETAINDPDSVLFQNNCLIIALKKAAFGRDAQVTPAELLAIRTRIGEFGTMLFASQRVINIICEVLNIQRGVVVIYHDNRPSEDFGDTSHNPVMIQHTGHAHFVPYSLDGQPAREGGHKRKHSTSHEKL